MDDAGERTNPSGEKHGTEPHGKPRSTEHGARSTEWKACDVRAKQAARKLDLSVFRPTTTDNSTHAGVTVFTVHNNTHDM